MISFKPSQKKKYLDKLEQASPDRYGDLSKQIQNQRRNIYALLILIAFLVMTLASLAWKSNIEVLVLEKDHNNYTYLGVVHDLTKETYKPDDSSIEYFLNNFIVKSRFLPTDLVLYKKNQRELGFFLSTKSIKKLDETLENDGYPEMITKNFAIDIELISILRLSKETFQIRWFEKTYDSKGNLVKKEVMVGMLRYEIQKPSRKEIVLVNPLGIVITDLSFSREKK
ncbi:MAG: type IV secretion system protein [Fusobacterium necrophorum]|nr:type IV secretion system protein [Fusobacterium necrophorum]